METSRSVERCAGLYHNPAKTPPLSRRVENAIPRAGQLQTK
jgi:hypothetical protein